MKKPIVRKRLEPTYSHNGVNVKRSELLDERGKFKKGHPKIGGHVPSGPRGISAALLNGLIEAITLVGYDADVHSKDENGNDIRDERKRIQGMIPYLQRTAELHRVETLQVIAKVIAPILNSLQVNIDSNGAEVKATREDLEKQLANWGININIFHGDEGRKPLKLIDHDLDKT